MTVTLSLLLEEHFEGRQMYAPSPGTAYEVAPGKEVVLCAPTLERQETFTKAAETLDEADPVEGLRAMLGQTVEVAKIVTEGEWPDVGELLPNVVQRIIVDFMSASGVISRPLPVSSDALSQLATAIQSKLGGQHNGEAATKAGAK